MAAPIIKGIVTASGNAQLDYESLINKPTAATTTRDGLMSASDKTKLDQLVDDYQKVINIV